MVVFHLKHSYLNWRVISCKRRTNCVYVIFFFQHFFEFCFLDFLFKLNWISQVHDMTIKFLFLFFFSFLFLISTTFLLRATTHTIEGLLDWKQHFSRENCFEKCYLLVQDCSCHFCPKKKVMAQKCSQEIVNFLFGRRALRY